MNNTTYHRLRLWAYPELPPKNSDTTTAWKIQDYIKCIKWIEINHSALLGENERSWMDEPVSSQAWQINMKIFLEILLIEVSADENLEDCVISHFDEIVQRLIEETYANPDVRRELRLNSEDGDQHFIDPSVASFACELAGLPPHTPLTIREISAILRSRFLKPSKPQVPDTTTSGGSATTSGGGGGGGGSMVLEDLCRRLCQKRLIDVQTCINGALAQMQEVTANINTDYRQARTTGG